MGNLDQTTIEEITNFAKAVDEYGSAVMIVSIFLLVFLAMTIYMLKSNQKSTQQLLDQQQQLIDNLINRATNTEANNQSSQHQPSYDEKNIVEIFCKLDTHLKSECKELSTKTNCDRIGVYVFHNGATASHGLPFFKVSCICEYIKTGSGIESHIKDSSNLPLTLFDDIISKLYTESMVVVRNSDKEAYHSTAFFLDKDGIDTALYTVVYDSHDNVMAFILGEYKEPLTDEKLDIYEPMYIDMCLRLRPVLEFSEYQKINDSKER